ncbi:MAG: 4Fe-4S binding protein [Methanobrevibacter sp.]|jgi:ferredoxin|nr:4Fe-4S binding protein [Candidatus Methanovirga basalitermitum]
MEIKFRKKIEDFRKELIFKSVNLNKDVKEFNIKIKNYETKNRIFTISPRCVRCDLCVKECPVDAISSATMVEKSKINEKCVKCEICAKTCPVSCIHLMEVNSKVDSAENKVVYNFKELKFPHRVLRMEEININQEKCVNCGNCTKFCPTKAVSLRRVLSESESFEKVNKQITQFKDKNPSTLEKVIKVESTNKKYTYINQDLCVGCGSCSNLCPQSVITLKRYLGPIIQTKKLLINQDICVQCYLCEESCPVDAIKLEYGKVVLDNDKCVQCDVCNSKCPVSALSLENIT